MKIKKLNLNCRGCEKAVDFLIQEIWLLRRYRSRLLTNLETTTKLLKRWDAVEVPSIVWSEPGEDYLLPTDTQKFLAENNDD